MRGLAIAVLGAALAGCGRPPEAPPREAAPAASGGGVVDALTGKTTVDAGRRARDQVLSVSSQEQGRVREVLEDM